MVTTEVHTELPGLFSQMAKDSVKFSYNFICVNFKTLHQMRRSTLFLSLHQLEQLLRLHCVHDLTVVYRSFQFRHYDVLLDTHTANVVKIMNS